jgi:hypothetical protein
VLTHASSRYSTRRSATSTCCSYPAPTATAHWWQNHRTIGSCLPRGGVVTQHLQSALRSVRNPGSVKAGCRPPVGDRRRESPKGIEVPSEGPPLI